MKTEPRWFSKYSKICVTRVLGERKVKRGDRKIIRGNTAENIFIFDENCKPRDSSK